MKYTIRQFIEETGQIVISVDKYEGAIAIDLPLDENNNVPTDQDLDLYVQGFIPKAHIERIEKLKAGIPNAAKIKALVEPWPEPIIENTPDIINPEIKGVDSLPTV